MKLEFFDPSPDELEVIVVGANTLHMAEEFVLSYEACNPDAEIPFDWIIDHVTERRGSTTDYVLAEPARCPNCRREIKEKTLVEPKHS